MPQKPKSSSNKLSLLQKSSLGKIFLGISGLILIVGLATVIHGLNYEDMTKWIAFDSKSDAVWYRGIWGYFLAGILFTSLAGPRQALAFFGGFYFGFWPGLWASTGAVILGCIIDAGFGKIFEKKVRRLIKGRIDIAFSFWRDHPFSISMILRLLPVGSNFLNNLAAGATGIALAPFVLGSAIGYIPQMVIFSLLGSGVEINSIWQISLAAGLFVSSMAFGTWLYKRHRGQIQKSAQSHNSRSADQ